MRITTAAILATALLGSTCQLMAQDTSGKAAAPAKKMELVRGASKMNIKSMNMPGIDAFLQDLVASDDKVAPMACGLFRLKKSEPLTYDYTYDEAKIILDGTMTVSDGHSTATVTRGDVLFFPKGSRITFTTASEGLGFICGQRARDGA